MGRHPAGDTARGGSPTFKVTPGADHHDASAMMITEMNHRWYNALQVLSSSLGLVVRRGDTSSSVAEHLRRVQDQVAAMADVHRRLCLGPQPGETIQTYCDGLCSTIIRGFDRCEIAADVRMCDAPLSSQGAMRLGAIVVELMTNALKHGRVLDDAGTVWFDLRADEAEGLELLVSDSFENSPMEGVQVPRMIKALVEGLSGKLRIKADPTYVTRISFPLC